MKLTYTLVLVTVMFFAFSGEAIAQNLATIKAEAQLSNVEGRSIVKARDHYLVVDAPPPLGGPNEAINPIEILLSALASCAVLVSERVAHEMDMSLAHASATVEGQLDPRGVKGEDVNPSLQVFRVNLQLDGPTKEQAAQLVGAIKSRCPIYTTLERSAPIEMEVSLASKK
jgi:uncharacterized OsmC-like protein